MAVWSVPCRPNTLTEASTGTCDAALLADSSRTIPQSNEWVGVANDQFHSGCEAATTSMSLYLCHPRPVNGYAWDAHAARRPAAGLDVHRRRVGGPGVGRGRGQDAGHVRPVTSSRNASGRSRTIPARLRTGRPEVLDFGPSSA